MKNFLRLTQRKDAKWVKARKTDKQTKFKVRTSKYLYTLIVNNRTSANKLKAALPASIEKRGLLANKKAKKAAAEKKE